jgi:hypothetical protein
MKKSPTVRTFVKRHLLALSIPCAVGLAAAGCSDGAPTGPSAVATASGPVAGASADVTLAASADVGLNQALARLRAATARYHDLAAAEADGFVKVTDCESGEVGIVYVKPDRIDATLDPSAPEGLLYEPAATGRPRLAGVELVLPYGYGGPEPPTFFGHEFQPEDEFGVWGLHVWVWRHNPAGLFAYGNPNVTCAE